MTVSSVPNSAVQLAAHGGPKKLPTEKELNGEITELKAELHKIDMRLGELRTELAELERKPPTPAVLAAISAARKEIEALEKKRILNVTVTEQKVSQRDAMKTVRQEGEAVSPEEDVDKEKGKNPFAKVFGADLSRFNELQVRARRDMLTVMTDRTPAPAMNGEQISGMLLVLDMDAAAEQAERGDAGTHDLAGTEVDGDAVADAADGEAAQADGAVAGVGGAVEGEASGAARSEDDGRSVGRSDDDEEDKRLRATPGGR